jgi:hypothetical protein
VSERNTNKFLSGIRFGTILVRAEKGGILKTLP